MSSRSSGRANLNAEQTLEHSVYRLIQVVTAGALLAMLLIVTGAQYQMVRDRFEVDAVALALHIDESIRPSLTTGELPNISDRFDRLQLPDNIARACLYDAKGSLLFERNGAGVGACERNVHLSAEARPAVATELDDASKVLATLHVFTTTRAIGRTVADAVMPVALLALILFLVTSVLSRRLAATAVSPVNALTAAAQALARGQLGVRMPEGGPSEVRALAQTYNEVIDDLLDTRRAAQSDVTERRRAPEALADTEALLRNIIDLVPYLIFAVRKDGRLLFANRAVAQAYGAQPSALLDPQFTDEYTGQRPDGLLFTQGLPPVDDEIWFTTPRGVRRLQITRVPFDGPSGEPLDADLVIALDVTEERRLQVQLQFSQRLEVVGTLAGGIAHDFNNLLTPIMGYSTVLMDRDLPEDAAAKIKSIYGAALKARDLVQQILTFSRNRDEPTQKLLIDPAEVLEDAMNLMRATIPSSIEIDFDIDADVPAINAHAGQIHQVVVNLCTNAAQAIAGAHGHIGVRLGADTDHVILTVTDDGTGMPDEVLGRVFEPFFTTKEIGHGSGLGLSVVHGIVTDHGGEIIATSKEGVGSTFTVRLPRSRMHSVAAVQAPAAPAIAHERVMLVDDEASVVRASKDLLENLGYTVQAFTQAETALQRFREDPQAIDVIVTDNLMPGTTGLEFAVAARKLRKDIPIVLMSGFVDDAAERSTSITVSIMKPVSGRELSATIQQAIRKDRAA